MKKIATILAFILPGGCVALAVWFLFFRKNPATGQTPIAGFGSVVSGGAIGGATRTANAGRTLSGGGKSGGGAADSSGGAAKVDVSGLFSGIGSAFKAGYGSVSDWFSSPSAASETEAANSIAANNVAAGFDATGTFPQDNWNVDNGYDIGQNYQWDSPSSFSAPVLTAADLTPVSYNDWSFSPFAEE